MKEVFYREKQLEGEISLLYVTDDKFVYVCSPREKLRTQLSELRQGMEPTGRLPKGAVSISIPSIKSIEHIPCEEGIVIRYRKDQKAKSRICVGHRDLKTAEGVARAVGVSSAPVNRLATFAEISFLPGAVMTMVTVASILLIGLAVNWDPSKTSWQRGKARAFGAVVEMLGVEVIVGLSLIAPLAIAAWWWYRYATRPTATVYER